MIVGFPCSSRGYVGKRYIMQKMSKVAQATRSYDRRLGLLLTVSRELGCG
jgi:hypothetical protein